MAAGSAAAAERRLFSFNATNGLNPQTALAQASDGSFYGSAVSGGNAGGFGTIYRLSASGVVTPLYAFPQADGGTSGGNLISRLVQGSDGNLYGSSQAGGSAGLGTVFKVSSAGVFTVVYTFTGAADGSAPGELVFGSNGNLYGTTAGGNGSVFQLTTAGVLTTLHTFTGGAADAANPTGGALVLGIDGSFYGVSSGGGSGSGGTVYKIAPSSGVVSVLHSFSGTTMRGGLIRDASGNFYGMTADPAQSGIGSAFKITASGTFTTLHTFSGSDGYSDGAALVLAGDGNLYGTTASGGASNLGTVFQLRPDGAVFNTLHNFTGGSDGGAPTQGLLLGRDGNFYGTTPQSTSGTAAQQLGKFGTVFRITNAGSFSTLNSFGYDNGAGPNADLISSGGLIYGTTAGADLGTVYSITSAGSIDTLYRFDTVHGASPAAGLVMGIDGNFYGTTLDGGSAGVGTAYRITTAGILTTLYSFSGVNDGGNPAGSLLLTTGGTVSGTLYGTTRGGAAISSGTASAKFFSLSETGTVTALAAMPGPATGDLVLGQDGNFYGTTADTGSGANTVFQVTPAGAVTTLHSFAAGTSPGPLVLGADGVTFYGTTQFGGVAVPSAATGGTVFSITQSGTFTSLYSFQGGTDGASPLGGLILASDGNFYGTTSAAGASGFGTVFRMGSNGQPLTVYAFTGGSNGAAPLGRLLQASDGNFYGATTSGGDSNAGTLFEIDGPPLTPANLAVSFSGTEADLSWTASGGATSYNVYSGNAAGAESATPLLTVTTNHAAVTGLNAGGTYYFIVKAVNAVGSSVASNEVVAMQSIPPAPASLTVTAGDGGVELSWSAAAGAASYSVYQGTSPGGEGATPVQSGLTRTSVGIGNLTDGTAYYFFVKAVNALGTGPASNEVSATPAVAVVVVPVAPTGLTVSASDGQLSLTWNTVSGATSYNVYQGSAPSGESSTPVQSGVSSSVVTITGLTNGQIYYFYVKAVNSAGVSPQSNEASGTPAPPQGSSSGGSGGSGGGGGAMPASALLGLALAAALRRRRTARA